MRIRARRAAEGHENHGNDGDHGNDEARAGRAGRAATTGAASGVRRAAGRLRGWGGVSAMAVACATTAAAVLLPLAHATPDTGRPAVHRPASMAAAAPWALTDTCQDPEASLRPSDVDGAAIARIKAAYKLVAACGPEQLPLGLPQPDRRGQPPRRLRHRPGQGHRQGHPGRRERGHLPGHPDQSAHPRPPGGARRHRRADHDHQLQAAGGRRLLDRLLRGRTAGPGAQGLADHRVRPLAEGPADLFRRRFHGGGGPEGPVVRLGAGHRRQSAGLPGPAAAGRGRRHHHGQRPRGRSGRPGPVGAAGGLALHPRVLRGGDEQGRLGPGPPGQQGAGELPRGRR